jgi:hypothetical protein
MYRLIMCAIVALFVDNQAVAQTPGISGNWQVTSVSILWLDTNEATRPYGEHPIGYVQYSPGAHMVVFLSVGDLKPAAGATYTTQSVLTYTMASSQLMRALTAFQNGLAPTKLATSRLREID